MKYTAKLPPEGINVSQRNHLKDFFVLLTGFIGLILIVVMVLAALADKLVTYIPLDIEKQLFQKMHHLAPIAADPTSERGKVEKYLENLVTKINKGWPAASKQESGTEPAKQKFTIAVVQMSTPNAFILPGGHIGVTQGLLRLVKSENGLAMVLAHEMAHQYKRHPLRSLGRGMVVLLALSVFTRSDGSWVVGSLSNSLAKIGFLKFSRDQEREADRLGLTLLLNLYGHNKGSGEFFEAIAKTGKTSLSPIFLQSHPAAPDRLIFLTKPVSGNNDKLVALPQYVIRFAKSNFKTNKQTLKMLQQYK